MGTSLFAIRYSRSALFATFKNLSTSAGVFAKEHKPGRRDVVRDEMAARVEKVLTVMAGHGHDAAVLGAWGCGVFKNDPEMIADLFADALRVRFAGVFDVVAFAVLDSTADGSTIGPFADRFGGITSLPG